jgi:FPC/CPF motif-containing protein YcgG
MGTFEQVRDKIRARDEALQGEVNPVVKDHGEESEAKQYSGRKVEDNWKCPFHPTIKN